jgi:hypothetical protein
MSWSISIFGTPENVTDAIEKHSENLTGDSKKEFDEAKLNIKNLVSMNKNSQYPIVIHVEASGHAYSTNEQQYSTCFVSIKQIAGQSV